MYRCHAAQNSIDVNIPQLAKKERIAPHKILPNDENRYMCEQKQKEMRDAEYEQQIRLSFQA